MQICRMLSQTTFHALSERACRRFVVTCLPSVRAGSSHHMPAKQERMFAVIRKSSDLHFRVLFLDPSSPPFVVVNHQMKIGIIGTGDIGATLARKFASRGHKIKVANSRGPQSISELAHEIGADAVTKEEAVQDVEVIIISIPFAKNPDLADLIRTVPSNVVVIDTSNYIPQRDGQIAEIDNGKAESVWLSEVLGHPIVKAWNALGAITLADYGRQAGAPGRIAIPVAGDDENAKSVAMELVEQTGFDAVDSGGLAESWRQQAGTPVFCTEAKAKDIKELLALADRERASRNLELILKELGERGGKRTHEESVRFTRSINIPSGQFEF